MLQDADALPQLIGDWKAVDQWQAHINQLFYRFRGDQIRKYYQTFASADYRLAHALAADYCEQASKRDKASKDHHSASSDSPLTIVELGPGNGNLAGCFLSHLKTLDRDGRIYPRVRYLLVDWEQSVLDAAVTHPALEPHAERICTVRSTVDHLSDLADGSVDRILCNELWNDLPTKLMLSPSANFQARPSKDDHIEVWYTNLNLANSKDNWYRGSQGVYVFSKVGNTKTHIGDEIDFTWTHMFMDGKVAFQATYSYLFSGGYIGNNLGTSVNQTWAYAQLWINF